MFSHGVLHHIPDILGAQAEIHRVLKPGGKLVVMLYARRSLNYLLSIAVVRRLALLAVYPFARLGLVRPKGMLGQHIRQAREAGLREYLRLEQFTHHSTDGPESPFARVYDLADVQRDFPSFRIERSFKRFMHAPPLPVHNLPGGSLMGSHLWVHLTPRPLAEHDRVAIRTRSRSAAPDPAPAPRCPPAAAPAPCPNPGEYQPPGGSS